MKKRVLKKRAGRLRHMYWLTFTRSRGQGNYLSPKQTERWERTVYLCHVSEGE